jgi:ABC-type glutathione transport system ATPase component
LTGYYSNLNISKWYRTSQQKKNIAPTANTSPPVLELRGINQTYFDEKTMKDFVVFNDFNLAVEDYPDIGSSLSSWEKSGCGKSTLLRYWTGLQKRHPVKF